MDLTTMPSAPLSQILRTQDLRQKQVVAGHRGRWTETMNFFAHQTASKRYAQGCPYFHPLVIDLIRGFLKLRGSVSIAVDVACGTGQSSLALADIATSVIATDLLESMLAQAQVHERIQYIEAPAEHLPIETQSVDLITVSLAFHWFDRNRFLAEAHRILRPDGTLVIYNNAFFGQMKENPEFALWSHEKYPARYPSPPRNAELFDEQDANACNFTFAGRERYTNDISFSPEDLVRYLTTQSNVIAAVEQGHESLQSVSQWLIDSTLPMFSSPKATFIFGGEIWFLRPLPNQTLLPRSLRGVVEAIIPC